MGIANRPHVLVVGGGPAGSSTATRLSRAGVDVTLVDQASFPREKACAEYCSPGVVDALDALGALPRIYSRDHSRLPRMQIVARGQPILLDFEDRRPDGNLALGIKRSVLDSELLEQASDVGTTVFEQTRAIRPIIEDSKVCGAVVRSNGDEREIRADFVVIADGLNSTLARALDLHRPIRWPLRLGLVARFTGLPERITAGQMHIGDHIYCGLTPVSDAEANVSLVVPMGYKPVEQSTGDFFDEKIQSLPGISTLLGDAERISDVRGIGPLGKRARQPAGNGYLLVGDASGFFDPLTGEGIHRALDGGDIAAQATLRALQRADRRPVGYRRARKRLFSHKQHVCRIIQLMIESPNMLDYVAERARNREHVNETLCGVLGDYVPANQALRAGFLWNLLHP